MTLQKRNKTKQNTLDKISICATLLLISEVAGIRSQRSLEIVSRALFVFRRTMKHIKYLSLDKQIEKLKAQKLIINDETSARYVLNTYGYYTVINGYRGVYIKKDKATGKKFYDGNTSIEQIYSLFFFDQHIRDAVMMAVSEFENHLKAAVSDVVGSSFGTNHKNYLKYNNYRDKKVTDSEFSRNKTIDRLSDTIEKSNRHPIPHYRKKYGIVPPWVLFTDTYLGTLVNFIKFLKGPERNALVRHMYGYNIPTEQMELLKELLHDTAFMCYNYRNRAAHGGIVYNFIPKTTLKLVSDGKVDIPQGLSQLYFALNELKHNMPAKNLFSAITNALNNFCKHFHTEEDIKRLQDSIGFKITSKKHVWVNNSTKKFHNNQHCSGMNNATKIDIADVDKLGLEPCKRCCK